MQAESDQVVETQRTVDRLVEAKRLLDDGSISAARSAIVALLKVYPQWLDCVRLQAEISLRTGNFPEALALFGTAAEIDPLDPTLYVSLTEVLEASGNVAEAEVYRVRADDHRDGRLGLIPIPARIGLPRLAILNERSGLATPAVSVLVQLVRTQRDRADLWLILGRALYRLRQWDRAGPALSAALDSAPMCLEANIMASALAARRGWRDEAETLFARAKASDPFGYRISRSLAAGDLPTDLYDIVAATLPQPISWARPPDKRSSQHADADESPGQATSIPTVDAPYTDADATTEPSLPGAESSRDPNPVHVHQTGSTAPVENMAGSPPPPSEPDSFPDLEEWFQSNIMAPLKPNPDVSESDDRPLVESATGPTISLPTRTGPQSPTERRAEEPRNPDQHSNQHGKRGRRWRIPGREARTAAAILAHLTELTARVEQEPLNNGARFELARAFETVDPYRSVTQYSMILESRDPRLVDDVRKRLEHLLSLDLDIPGLQRLMGDAYMQQGFYERAIEAYSIAFDGLRSRQISEKR